MSVNEPRTVIHFKYGYEFENLLGELKRITIINKYAVSVVRH